MNPLASLRKQHHALLPPYLLHLPSPAILAAEESQHYLVDHLLHDPSLLDRYPEKGYQRSFWRKIIAELEKGVKEIQQKDPRDEIEVDEVFYEHLASLMVSSPDTTDLPKQSFRTFVYDYPAWSAQAGQEGLVSLLEEQVAIQAGTTGLRTWTASLHLAHHILQSPHILSPDPSSSELPPCIELGAGTGFLSILLAQLGSDVIATDLDGPNEGERQAPLDRLRLNVGLNPTSHCRVEALDWGDGSSVPEERLPIWQELTESSQPRTVVAADVIYDPDLVPLLVAAIHTLINPSSSTRPPSIAIVSATVRNPTTLELFVRTCRTPRSIYVSLTLPLVPMDAADPTFWDSALDAGSEVRIMRISTPS